MLKNQNSHFFTSLDHKTIKIYLLPKSVIACLILREFTHNFLITEIVNITKDY